MQNETGSDEQPDTQGRKTSVTSTDPASPGAGHLEQRLVLGGFGLVQRALLILVGLMTLTAAGIEIADLIAARSVDLGDILLMFLYAEVIAMVAVFYSGRGLPMVYPIFVAITALARLIVLQGKDMDPQKIVLEASAILLLAIAAVVLLRLLRDQGL
jgi:protein PsiE